MMKIVLVTILFIMSLLANDSIPNMQYEQMKKMYLIRKNSFLTLISKLHLTFSQKQKIREILSHNQEKYNIGHLLYPLADSIEDSKFNKEKFIKLKEAMMKNFIEKRANLIAKILKILTPAQKTKLKELINATRK